MHSRRTLLNSIGFFALLSLVGLAACGRAQADGVTQVDGARARELVAAGATLLDVRTTGEFASGHIDGAVNIPVSDLAARQSEVPRGRVVVYCQSGGRSSRAASLLASAGYEVYDLGGIARW